MRQLKWFPNLKLHNLDCNKFQSAVHTINAAAASSMLLICTNAILQSFLLKQTNETKTSTNEYD